MKEIVEAVNYPWFHSFLDGNEANRMAQNDGKEGSFLIRFSGIPRCYALAVKHNGTPHQWRIYERNRKFHLDNMTYKSLNELVEIHRKEALRIGQLLNTGNEFVKLGDPLVNKVQQRESEK